MEIKKSQKKALMDYILSNFDLDNFEKEYEHLIREHSIHKYVKNTDFNILYVYIFKII